MRKNILILAIVAGAGYLVGVESAKSLGKNYEDLRHQVERLWNDPAARKSRRRAAKNLGKSLERTRKSLLGN